MSQSALRLSIVASLSLLVTPSCNAILGLARVATYFYRDVFIEFIEVRFIYCAGRKSPA